MNPRRLLIPACGLLAALILFTLSAARPARAELVPYQPDPPLARERLRSPAFQTFTANKCRLLLQKTAERLGWASPEIYVNDYGSESNCQVSYIGEDGGVAMQVVLQITVQAGWCDDFPSYCEKNPQTFQCLDIHGLPGRLSRGEGSQGSFLTFCDAYCRLVFRVNTRSDDNHPVDTRPYADALYYSALEVNCCQVGEAAPPLESLPPAVEATGAIDLPPVGDQPPSSDNPPGDIPAAPPAPGEPLSARPLVPLIGALVGTLAGWLVSVAAASGSTLAGWFSSTSRPGPNPAPPGDLPATWEEWERRYNPRELPTYRGPDIYQNSAVHISVEDAKQEVLQFFAREMPAESQARVAQAHMRKLEAAEFDAEYLRAFGKDGDYTHSSAFVNPRTGEMLVCTPREINYTPVHELMHVAANTDFGSLTNQALDEAVTEYFTKQITDQRKIIRSSQYEELGSTDVVAELVRAHGEGLLRRAYFQPGERGVAELRRAVDQKLGPGAFNKMIELVGRPYAPPKQVALDLLRGRGIRR